MAEGNQIEKQGLKIWNRLVFQHRIGVAVKIVLLAAIAVLLLLTISSFFSLEIQHLVVIFILVLAVIVWFGKKNLKFSDHHLINSLNHQYRWLEFSAHLIPVVPSHILQQLQRERILHALAERKKEVKVVLPDLKIFFFALGGIFFFYVLGNFMNFSEKETPPSGRIESRIAELPAVTNEALPEILSLEVEINPPPYTGRSSWFAEKPSFEAPEGSQINFNIELSAQVDTFQVIKNGEDTLLVMPASGNSYVWTNKLATSEFYQFYFSINHEFYSSPVYTIHAIEDKPPVVTIQYPAPYTFIFYGQQPKLDVAVKVSDDYGLNKAQLVATVSRGSGESVKFREEKLEFSGNINGSRNALLQKQLDFVRLQMEPGDELYFFVQAWDYANPPNLSRSETHFVQWEDTTSNTLSLMDGIAVDNMPAYFRSQRQIIIDTEKLIKEQNSISKEEFTQRSNDLGIDQKVLRLRYGKFLGEEFETTIVRQAPVEANDHDHDDDNHDHDQQEENGLKKNVEQLDDHDHTESGTPSFGSGEGMMEQYEHRHDVAEAATFFEEATKTQLKAALAQMWEAELRLRTLQPKEALEFEYKALELIKAVQEKNRVYVERVGFEPPPLKPGEKRLTGDLDEVTDPERSWDTHAIERAYPRLRRAFSVLEDIRQNPEKEILPEQRKILEEANQELAIIILQQPAINAKILNSFRGILSEEKPDIRPIQELQHQIAKLLPMEDSSQKLEVKNPEPELNQFIDILKD